MGRKVVGLTGAGRGEVSAERLAQRNGHRERDRQTRSGTVEPRIPRLRRASHVPGFLEPRRMAEKTLTAVIQDEATLTADIVGLAEQYGQDAYRRITALLRDADWAVNRRRAERIWRREGLKVPQRQPKRGRLWLADGSCIRLRPEHANHVSAYAPVEDQTRDGPKFRMLCVVDEFTREALAIGVARKVSSTAVIDVLHELFIARGSPFHLRSDQEPEFIAGAMKAWITGVGAKTASVEKASPWEHGYVEIFNAKLRDGLLKREVFNTLRAAEVLIEEWRQHDNPVRPHSSLGYRWPAPKIVPMARSRVGAGAGVAAMAH